MNPNENELYHHGIKGMHWGIRRTPEQLGYRITKKKKKLDKTYEQAKAAASKRDMKKLEKLSKKAVKQSKGIEKTQKKYNEAKELEDKIKEQQAKELAEKKDRIFKSGNAAEIYANRELFSTNELNDAINRANTMTKLKDLNKQDMVIKMDKARNFIDGVANVGKSLKGAADSYNDLAKVINGLAGEKKLPTFDTKGDAFEKLLRTGDAKLISKALPNMTDEQVGRASKRLSNESVIKNYADKATKSVVETKSSESSKASEPSKSSGERKSSEMNVSSDTSVEATLRANNYTNLSDKYPSMKSDKTTVSKGNSNYGMEESGASSYVSPTFKTKDEAKFYSTGKEYVQSYYNDAKYEIPLSSVTTSKTSWKDSGGVTGDFYRDGNKYMRDNANTWAKVTVNYKNLG